jgi:hypothetical protein
MRRESGDRIARTISDLANPIYLSIPTFLTVSLVTAPDPSHALLWCCLALLGSGALPWLYIRYGIWRKRYSDKHLSVRQERLVPMMVAFACVVATFLLLLFIHASSFLLLTLIDVLVIGLIAIAITTRWKISLHLMAISGAITILILVMGFSMLILVPLIPLVIWARCRINAHTFAQTLLGSLIAVIITIGIFRR